MLLPVMILAILPAAGPDEFYRGGVIPTRDPQASPSLIDLSGRYTASLDNDWLVSPRVNLGSLPKGIQTLAGVKFEVRGILQLASTELLALSVLNEEEKARQYPRLVAGIPVRRRAEKVHFLQASAWSAGDGEKVGEYVVHYADGQQRSIPLLYGRSLIDWWVKSATDKPSDAEIAWHGSHARSSISLFKYTWANPLPGVAIDTIDFVSAMTKAAPFLVAITCEP